MSVTTGVTASAVYVLSHPMHPAIVKIGRTKPGGAPGRCEDYAKDHGMGDGWTVFAEVPCLTTELAVLSEGAVHTDLRGSGLQYRAGAGARELFRVNRHEAEALVRRIVGEYQNAYLIKAPQTIAKEKADRATEVAELKAEIAQLKTELAKEKTDRAAAVDQVGKMGQQWIRKLLGILVAELGMVVLTRQIGSDRTEFEFGAWTTDDIVEATRRAQVLAEAFAGPNETPGRITGVRDLRELPDSAQEPKVH